MPLLSAELAWYVTGRFYATSDGAVADYGYFLHLAGIAAELFNGPKSETTAHFTFAAQPFTPKGVTNGALNLGLDPVGEFSVYLQRTPAGNFDDPHSFGTRRAHRDIPPRRRRRRHHARCRQSRGAAARVERVLGACRVRDTVRVRQCALSLA